MFFSAKKMTSCLVHNMHVIINTKKFIVSVILVITFIQVLPYAARAQETHEPIIGFVLTSDWLKVWHDKPKNAKLKVL